MFGPEGPKEKGIRSRVDAGGDILVLGWQFSCFFSRP